MHMIVKIKKHTKFKNTLKKLINWDNDILESKFDISRWWKELDIEKNVTVKQNNIINFFLLRFW